MFQMLRKRLERDDEGFTLIELMVVVLIIAILIAIAIPTFLGAREKAQDRAAQSNIRNAFTAEKVFYTDAQAYASDTAKVFEIEPSLTYSAGTDPSAGGKNEVFVDVDGTSGVLTLSAKSASGKCWYLRDTPSGSAAGTTYAKGDCSSAPADTDYTTSW